MPTLTINHLTIGKEIKIAVSLMATTCENLFSQLQLIENSSAHIIEWRLDYLLDRNDIIELLKEIKKKTTKLILVTFRREEEGGVSPISSEEYFNLLKKMSLSVSYSNWFDISATSLFNVIPEKLELIFSKL